MKKDLVTTLNDIIKLSTTIDKIYQTITQAKINGNEEEIKKQLEYINLVSEYETKAYQQLDLEKNLSENLYNKFSYLLMCSDIPANLQEPIQTRFQNRINEIYLLNPFLSLNENREEQELENEAAIKFQADRDFEITNLYFLNKDIEKETNPIIRQELIKKYYYLIFTAKLLEPYLETPPTKIEATGRNRCILFNQNKEIVNSMYQEFIEDILEISINEILINYTDDYIASYPDKLAPKKIHLVIIKSSLALATQEEKENLRLVTEKETKITSSKSYRDITYAIQEANLTVQETAIQKKKF